MMSQTGINVSRQSGTSRNKAWLLMLAVDFFISVVTLIVFGAFGGLFMLVALNGFSESTGGMILMGYGAVVLSGNALVSGLFNLLIARRWLAGAGLPSWSPYVTAIAVTLVLLLVGPSLAFVLIPLVFKG